VSQPTATHQLIGELRRLAVDTATEAAALAARLRREGLHVDRKSTATDLVTNADRACEALIIERLLTARPDDGTLGEEGGNRTGTSGVVWIIDPIDGTTNFVYDHPGWNVSIGAEIEGEISAGAVVSPTVDSTYTAGLGQGATLNGRELHLGDAPSLAEALIGTGFSYSPTTRAEQARVLVDVVPHVRDVRRMGAAAVDLCSVGSARLDGYFERGLERWDLAAGSLVATEAGARVGGLDGGPAVPGETVIAAHRDLFDPLRRLLARD